VTPFFEIRVGEFVVHSGTMRQEGAISWCYAETVKVSQTLFFPTVILETGDGLLLHCNPDFKYFGDRISGYFLEERTGGWLVTVRIANLNADHSYGIRIDLARAPIS